MISFCFQRLAVIMSLKANTLEINKKKGDIIAKLLFSFLHLLSFSVFIITFV